MFNVRLATIFILLGALAAMLVSMAMPVPPHNSWLGFHAYLGVALGIAILYIGASGVFVKGFGGFTVKLKRSYGLLCIGFSLLGVASIELPLIIYSGSVETFFRSSGLAAAPFLLALFSVLIGTRALAKLFGVKSFTTSWWFVFAPPVVLAILYSLLPHAAINTPELEFDGSNAFSVFNTWVNALALVYILQIKRIASAQYTNALAWLALTFVLIGGAGLGYLILVLPLGNAQWFLIGAGPFVPMFFAGLCLLRAAYVFNRITVQSDAGALATFTARDFFGKPLHAEAKSQVSSVDIVVYAANLTSSSSEIEPILNRFRIVTASLQPGQKPSPAAEKTLEDIYLEIEEYLLKKETVRVFTKESLRQTIANSLRLTAMEQTFWNDLRSSGGV